MRIKINLTLLLLFTFSFFAQSTDTLKSHIIIVQPIVTQSDEGSNPAPMSLPKELVEKAYEKANIDFRFLEPIYFNNTKARDGEINLDQIVKQAGARGLIKGQNDIVNLFFVNAVDGHKGPLGRGMQGGNITFIALGDNTNSKDESKYMQAFVIAHEIGHNLSLVHAIDDPNVPDSIPNLQGDGEFKDRIDLKYSLNKYQIEVIHASPLVHPRIEFLSLKDGKKAILDESFEPYFSQLQLREVEAFVQEEAPSKDLIEVRKFARDKFASAVTTFSPDEKECLSFVTERTIEILNKNGLSIMAQHPWRFIKIEDWLCGGFAHTRGTYIILSQRHLNYLSKTWSKQMTPNEEKTLMKKLGGLIVHEQMHSLQRTYKTRFTKLYTQYWDFIQASVEDDESIRVNQVSNPDAPLPEWLIPSENEVNSYYWIRTLFREVEGIPVMGRDFIDKVFTVEKSRNHYSVKKENNGKLCSRTVEDIEFYKKSFPTSRGLDHPNEISAYIFSDYFKYLVDNKVPFNNVNEEATKNTSAFIDWIKSEM